MNPDLTSSVQLDWTVDNLDMDTKVARKTAGVNIVRCKSRLKHLYWRGRELIWVERRGEPGSVNINHNKLDLGNNQ